MRRMRTVTAAALCLFLAGCASPRPTEALSPATTPSPSYAVASPSVVADTLGSITFRRPAAWIRWQPNLSSPWEGGPQIYLSTDPLLPTCAASPAASPNPPSSAGRACEWPIASLSPNGVLVELIDDRILSALPTAGTSIEANGHPARLQIKRPGTCEAIGADETLTVALPIGQPTPLSNDEVVGCLRGPDLAVTEAQFRALVSSIAGVY
jgi:hypothetical protein